MGLPLAFMGVGMATRMMGGLQANAGQAEAERQNAYFFREQAEFINAAMVREVSLFDKKAASAYGETVGAYATSGIQLSGGALEVLAGERSKHEEERNAIIREGEFRRRLALLRAQQSERTADSLTSPLATFSAIAGPAAEFGAYAAG